LKGLLASSPTSMETQALASRPLQSQPLSDTKDFELKRAFRS